MASGHIRIPVSARADVDQARREARALAASQGFGRVEAERLALAVSELATNLFRYADDGVILLWAEGPPRGGVLVESSDQGPGIVDVERALEDGFSTGGGLGSGLPAVRRLLDGFEIKSGPHGTRITARLCPTAG